MGAWYALEVIPGGNDELLAACTEYVERQVALLRLLELQEDPGDVGTAMWAALDQLAASQQRAQRRHMPSRGEPGE
jgi:hypothetical protein